MRTIVKGKNFAVVEEDRRYAERKLHRLERFLDDRTDAIVELSVEQHRSEQDSRIVEVTLMIDGRVVRGVARAATHRAAVDVVLDRLERRAIAHREKPRLRARPNEEKAILRSIADGTAPVGRDRPPSVVKVKRFAIEPMFEEDAVARMEELGHAFFVFVNAENERLAVLYRRRDGDYGLIEPAIGGEYSDNGRTARRRS
ncbi:MAG: ribosomal subunit interface protein [Chloroflexi bacterium GWC2_73_18]|nr:MAG: ribosomal subunit interface protein [Chloroflexi bacterium GWC2_73_18]